MLLLVQEYKKSNSNKNKTALIMKINPEEKDKKRVKISKRSILI